jgi:hypothetical protein
MMYQRNWRTNTMTKAILPPTEGTRKCEPMRAMPGPLTEDPDILDWDVTIETPPPHRTGTIKVTLEYAGRGRPRAITDPDSTPHFVDTPVAPRGIARIGRID